MEKQERIRLPTEPTEPGGSLDDFAIFLHGEWKIGKTSLANVRDGTLFLQCDPPQKAYRRVEELIPNWESMRAVLKALRKLVKEKRPFPYARVVVDGADIWYEHCSDYVCAELGIKHPSDLGYGKGWKAVRKEFTSTVIELLSLPCSRWFISHSQWKKIEDRRGNERDVLSPRLPGMAEDILLGRCDLVACYDYDKKGRVIRLQESGNCVAGHRLDSDENPHFRHSKTGTPLDRIRVEGNAKLAHARLFAAFENRYPKKKG